MAAKINVKRINIISIGVLLIIKIIYLLSYNN